MQSTAINLATFQESDSIQYYKNNCLWKC